MLGKKSSEFLIKFVIFYTVDLIVNLAYMQSEDKPQTSVFYWGMFKDEKEFVPKQVTELAKANITKVGSGGFFFIASNDAGELWGWGTTKYNRFGIGGPDLIPAPKKIPLKFKVNKISAGNWHTLIIDS